MQTLLWTRYHVRTRVGGQWLMAFRGPDIRTASRVANREAARGREVDIAEETLVAP